MRLFITALACLISVSVVGQTLIPDANFKEYLIGEPLINTNGDAEIQVSEATAFNGTIYCASMNISDLTGIEDFIALTTLYCQGNQLTSLDVSGATALTTLYCQDNQLASLDVSSNTTLNYLHCPYNQLTSIDVSANIALTVLGCSSNQLTSLDLSNNTALTNLWCNGNQLTSLDVSNNTALTELICNSNQLTSLDVRNGNNINWGYEGGVFYFHTYGNSNLSCINVDNAYWSTENWTVANNNIDPQHYFDTDCYSSNIEELIVTKKSLTHTLDALGREVNHTTNQILFHIYDDGSVEKKFIVE